jgi:hypothetical protein
VSWLAFGFGCFSGFLAGFYSALALNAALVGAVLDGRYV